MKSVGIGLLVLVFVTSGAGAGVTTNVLDAEVRVSGEAALRRGVAWLEQQQAKDGGLGGAEYPAAVTALAVSALKAGGSTNQAVLAKAQDYVKQAMAKSSNDWTGSFSMTICQTAVGGKRPARDQAEWAKERRRLDRGGGGVRGRRGHVFTLHGIAMPGTRQRGQVFSRREKSVVEGGVERQGN